MPVDKFGRNGDRATTTVYTGINTANLTNTFLRRDGGNTAIGAIDMNSNIIKNVSDLVPLLVVGHGIFASTVLNYHRFAL